MRIVITGGQGFVGAQLARELLSRGSFRGRDIGEIVLADRVAPAPGPAGGDPDRTSGTIRVSTVTGDLAVTVPELFGEPVDVLFHLASAVSAECERDMDLGLVNNLDATRAVLNAARAQREGGGPPCTVVFSSSLAVYGPDPACPLPEVVSEKTPAFPQSSYGTQKLACEHLIADFTRRGFLDGRVVRLMTVCVRPGKPNAAASSFVSGIVREPLSGVEAVCPVGRDLELAISSPATTVAGILAVAEASRGSGPGQLTGRLAVNLPALTVTVGQMLDALHEVGGAQAASLVREEPDPAIEAIVRSWPARFDNSRAEHLGLRPDRDILDVVRAYRSAVSPG
ncbi:MAG: NAD-dependent epimerase [Micrococcales bacterium]|nr:MAG: NAD-dependent epimerase [Micrococcales bacterium]